MKLFENNKTKGAVSIFLIIVLVPTLILSAVLIDGSRMASARAMSQEAADLAAASVLASYNEKLKDEFGLFALEEKDAEKLTAIFEESLNATLLAYGMTGDEAYSERLWEIMKTTLTGQKSYMGESFLNLYDFNVEKNTVQPMFALANQPVLENQMIEYAKFRGIYVMADRMDFLTKFGDAKEAAAKNEETSQVMENKMDADEKNADANKALFNLKAEVEALQNKTADTKNSCGLYFNALKAEMKKIRIRSTDTEETLTSDERQLVSDFGSIKSQFAANAKAACEHAETVLKKAEEAQKEVEKAIDRLESFKNENQSKASGNEEIASMIQDADDNIRLYQEKYLPAIQKILEDPVINEMKTDTGVKDSLEDVMEDVEDAIGKYEEELEEMEEEASDEEDEEDGEEDDEEEDEEPIEYYYYFLDNTTKTTEINTVVEGSGKTAYRPAVTSCIDYFQNERWDIESLDPGKFYSSGGSTVIDKDKAKNQSGKTGNVDTDPSGAAQKGSVPDEIYNSRPSKSFQGEEGSQNDTGFYNEDGDLSASKNILNKGKHSMILDMAETARDDVLELTYMFGTFKTRLTGVNKFTSGGMSQSDKDSFYMPKWRYAHADGELDMRFTPKKERDTVLRSEIEYLVYGNKSDTANEAAVYATIFAERLANNMIALYGEKKVVNPSCHTAAAAASALTAGVVPEPVFFWIFLTAWSVAETTVEMDYLISGGYKIPLFKTPKNILLNEFPDADGSGLIGNYGESGLFVSYEDYLMILLLIKGREKRIMRTADLVEMNMRHTGQDQFTMAEAFTYVRADSELSIRYLFGDVMPFKETYEQGGYTGRMHFGSRIDMGY